MAVKKETIVISLGGSLVAPDNIDIAFLKNFKQVIEKYIKDSPKQFFIFVGGGKICRNYQKAFLEFGAKPVSRDWVGIRVTHLNAEVLCHVFGKYVHSQIFTNPNSEIKTSKKIVIGAGWKPGWSTDYDAVLAAKNNGAATVINLTNIDYVYDKNPNEFPDAKPLKNIDWKSFESIVGNQWTPGLSMPFDPKASKLAAKLGLKVIMINGKELQRLEDFLNGNEFLGTVIG